MNEDIFKTAFSYAKQAFDSDEVPVGAVIFDTNTYEIITATHNQTEQDKNPLSHAEILAIQGACQKLKTKRLTGYSIFVTLEPCVMCAGAIAWAQVSRVVFGAADEKRGYQRYAPNALHPKTVVEQGLMADEATALMKDFFKQRR